MKTVLIYVHVCLYVVDSPHFNRLYDDMGVALFEFFKTYPNKFGISEKGFQKR